MAPLVKIYLRLFPWNPGPHSNQPSARPSPRTRPVQGTEGRPAKGWLDGTPSVRPTIHLVQELSSSRANERERERGRAEGLEFGSAGRKAGGKDERRRESIPRDHVLPPRVIRPVFRPRSLPPSGPSSLELPSCADFLVARAQWNDRLSARVITVFPSDDLTAGTRNGVCHSRDRVEFRRRAVDARVLDQSFARPLRARDRGKGGIVSLLERGYFPPEFRRTM